VSPAGVPALLAGKTAVITGATRGIGLGIAEVFAAAGASLVLTGRDADAGQRAVAAMEATGTKAWFCAADMRDQAAVQAAVAAADRFGGIDILVQNAGMYPEQPIEQMTSDDWDLVQHTNRRCTFFGVQACLPAMRARRRGTIVVVASAGNFGPASGSISKPGDDPLVITAGATDDNGSRAADECERAGDIGFPLAQIPHRTLLLPERRHSTHATAHPAETASTGKCHIAPPDIRLLRILTEPVNDL